MFIFYFTQMHSNFCNFLIDFLIHLSDWSTESTVDKITWVPDLSYSPLWEDEIRREVMETKISEQQMNKLRSNLLVPGRLNNVNRIYTETIVSFSESDGLFREN